MCILCLQIFILNGDRRVLPFRGYFIPDQWSSPYFPYIYIFHMIVGCYCVVIIAAGISFNFITTTHACAKFVIVEKYLGLLRAEDCNAHKSVTECVNRHQDAIKYEFVLFFMASNHICFH